MVRLAAEHPSRLRLLDLQTRPAAHRTEVSVHRGVGCGYREYLAAWWPSDDAEAPRVPQRFWPDSWLHTAGRLGRGSLAHRSCPAAWRPSEGRCHNKLREERDWDPVSKSNRSLKWQNSRSGRTRGQTILTRSVCPWLIWPDAKHQPVIRNPEDHPYFRRAAGWLRVIAAYRPVEAVQVPPPANNIHSSFSFTIKMRQQRVSS